MRSRNNPKQRKAVGDASQVWLPAWGDACCELANDLSILRVFYLGKWGDLLSTKVKGDREVMWIG